MLQGKVMECVSYNIVLQHAACPPTVLYLGPFAVEPPVLQPGAVLHTCSERAARAALQCEHGGAAVACSTVWSVSLTLLMLSGSLLAPSSLV